VRRILQIVLYFVKQIWYYVYSMKFGEGLVAHIDGGLRGIGVVMMAQERIA
jgi:hypothetical protein